jgi:hypothetical protein
MSETARLSAINNEKSPLKSTMFNRCVLVWKSPISSLRIESSKQIHQKLPAIGA